MISGLAAAGESQKAANVGRIVPNTSSRGRGMKTEAEVEILVTALKLARDRRRW